VGPHVSDARRCASVATSQTTGDAMDRIVLLVATGVAVLVLAWLWRQGPAHRLAFFLVGVVIGLGFIFVGLYQDEVEGFADELSSEFIDMWEATQPTVLPEAAKPRIEPAPTQRPRELPSAFELPEALQPHGRFARSPLPYAPRTMAARVSLVFPAGWDVHTPTRVDDARLFPAAHEATSWKPVLAARGDGASCVLLDATNYAEALAFWDPGETLRFELDGYSAEPKYYPLTYLSRAFVGDRYDAVEGHVVALRSGPAGVIDVSLPGGRHQRHYLLNDEERWFYLMCSSKALPAGRWRSVAESFDWQPGSPSASPTPAATPSPPPTPAEIELRRLVPLSDCEGRDPASDQVAVIVCEATGGIKVAYMAFPEIDELREWWVRQFESVPSVPGAAAVESCEANEPAESAWHVDGTDHPGGHYVCRPARSVILPSVTWTDDALLLVGHATSGDVGVPELYQRWHRGDFSPVP
jgi:hypothetical protein